MNVKDFLMPVLAAVFVSGVSSTSFAAANPFRDVPTDHWAYDAVTTLAQDGVIEGYGDTTFKGSEKITRYEMAQMIAKAMAKKDVVLKGKAQAVLSTGGEVSADEISWLHSEDKITATGKVRIVKDDAVATADKATTDTGIENLRLEGNAEVQKGAGI